MDEIHVSIDVDKWEYGRNGQGQLSIPWLKSAYPYIQVQKQSEIGKILRIAHEYLEPDQNDQIGCIARGFFIFFQSKEDRDLVETLRLLH